MGTYWAWKESNPIDKEHPYRFIYPAKSLVEMCSPDDFKKAEREGRGKIVEVEIKEVSHA